MQERLVTGLSVLLLIITVTIQSTGLISFFGVKVNIILVFLVTLSFFLESSKSYLIMLLLASMLSALDAWLSREFIALFVLGLLIILLRKKFFSPGPAANAIFIGISTFVLYLILRPTFTLSSMFFVELALNEIAGLIFFVLFAKATGLNYRRNVSRF